MRKNTRVHCADPELSLTDASHVFGLSVSTIFRLRRKGKLRAVKLSEGRVGLLSSDVREFLASRETAEVCPRR
jgi:predicted DNA-binding transcriptional regulator AlpA